MNASITKCATVERAREVVKKLQERNRSTWNDLDRETAFAINALVSEAERLRNLYSIATAAERDACAKAAGIALLGADRDLTERVLNTIRARGRDAA